MEAAPRPTRALAPLTLAASLALGVACTNTPLEIAPPSRPLVYVALGASDAAGVGATDPAQGGWVPVLHRHLPEGTRLVNLGISGSRLREALAQQLPVALDAMPDLVTVWLAVNDFNARVPLDEYAADLDELLQSLTAHGHPQVVIANIPDLTLVPVYAAVPADVLRAEIARWNTVIAAAAERHGAVLVDLYPLTLELLDRPDLVGSDGFHPSDRGHRRLADIVGSAIPTDRLAR